jgi:hypothetical protein
MHNLNFIQRYKNNRIIQCWQLDKKFLPVNVYIFYVALQPNTGYDPLIHEVFEITHTHRATVGRTPLDE